MFLRQDRAAYLEFKEDEMQGFMRIASKVT